MRGARRLLIQAIVFLGDYTGIAALNGRVYGAWTEVFTPGRTRSTPAAKPSTVVKLGIADFQTQAAH